MRDVLVYKNTKDTNLLKNFTLLKEIEELEKVTDNSKLSDIITYLSELEANIKGATFPNILLESSLIQLISESAKQVIVNAGNLDVRQVSVPAEKMVEKQVSAPVEKLANSEVIQKQEVNNTSVEVKSVSTSGSWSAT